jgi:hypothetical protein
MPSTADVRKIIQAAIDRDREEPFGRVLDALRPFEGKKITKRIATAVEKAIPEYTVYYDGGKNVSGIYHLTIWGNGISMDQRIQLYLGSVQVTTPHGEPIPAKTFFVERFLDANCCYYEAAQERNAKRRKLLKNTRKLDRIAAAINAFRDAATELHSVTSNLTDGIELRKLAGLDY